MECKHKASTLDHLEEHIRVQVSIFNLLYESTLPISADILPTEGIYAKSLLVTQSSDGVILRFLSTILKKFPEYSKIICPNKS